MEIRNIEDKGGDVIRTKYYDGIYFPPRVQGDVKDHFEAIKNFKQKDGDVFIDTFPKSGTHWAYEIVHMLQTGKAEYSPDADPCMEFGDIGTFDKCNSPRTFKSHLYPQHLPKFVLEGKCKVIYVYRNPKDTAVSTHSFLKQITVRDWKGYNGKWENFFELYASEKIAYNGWFQHVKSWLDFRKTNPDIPVLIISYEDMKRDLRSCVQKISKHLDANQDPEFLDEVASKCQFSAMSKAKKENQGETVLGKNGINPFYRKGEVGDWKNWFTVAQNEMFDKVLKEKMADIDLKIEYTL